jgi:hypothetical protein
MAISDSNSDQKRSRIEKNIPKTLIIGLIYPAVLGSIIYSLYDILGLSIFEHTAKGYLQGSYEVIICKSFLFLLTIVFYCLDFLYSVFTKNFRWLFFGCDIGILLSIVLVFKAIDIHSAEYPLNWLALLGYFGFMSAYFIWDWNEKAESDDEGNFLKKMIRWEIIFGGIFLALFALCLFDNWILKIGNYLWTFLTILAIGIATGIGIPLVLKKRELYNV